MTQPYANYQIPGFRGMVTYIGSERLQSGNLTETLNLFNETEGDLKPRPGLIKSTNFTGFANAPITLLFFQRFNKFGPQGGAGSGAQSNTTALAVAGTNTNPGFTTGTQSSGLPGGSGAGALPKHHHTADTNAEGGFLHLSTIVSNDGETIKSVLEDVFNVNNSVPDILGIRSDAKITNGSLDATLSTVLDIGKNSLGGGAYRVSELAVEIFDTGTTNEPAGYKKVIRPDFIGKVKTADIAIGATGDLDEVDLAGVLLGVEHTGVKNITGALMGLDSFWNVGFDWKNNTYVKGQRII